jgi:circadian clock protein KaiC
MTKISAKKAIREDAVREEGRPLEDRPQLPKACTGITGFDLITLGGVPKDRPTLVCGGPGCGKTLFAMTFLVNGIVEYGEPGVFMTFEENAEAVAANVASLGFDVAGLVDRKKLVVDYVRIERSEIEESGDYDLEALFVRLDHAISTIGAKRVVLDTLEALFSGLSNTAILRAELRRLFGWLKERGVTAIITGERGDGDLTRHGLEEYVSDCVILLDVAASEQVMTRRLRVVKYRGSAHGTNEYPFLIDDAGISVLPITSAGLAHAVNDEIIASGVPGLDAMLGLGGFYKGSSVLFSGGAGTGKTTFAGSFANAAARAGKRCLYFAFEESPQQIVRNLRSTGLDLQPHIDAGLLRFEASRPSTYGYEMHLARMNRDMDAFKPEVVIVDPLSAFRGTVVDIHNTLMRMVDMLKARGVTAVFTRLISSQEMYSGTDQGISSLIDAWVLLEDLEVKGERTRGIHLMKARGMNHSGQVRQYVLSDKGIGVIAGAFAGGNPVAAKPKLAKLRAEKARKPTPKSRR